MILFPPAKINLGLTVLNRREDGFHNIETLFFLIGMCDVLEVIPVHNGKGHKGIELHCSGLVLAGSLEDNLVVRAYRLMASRFDLPGMTVWLHKHIPTGAGLGGGSSDGAMMLKAINQLTDSGLQKADLIELALELGSDCPFFIDPRPVIASGRGELFKEVAMNLKGIWLYLFHPREGVSTAAAYQEVGLSPQGVGIEKIIMDPLPVWRYSLKNSFEEYAIKTVPKIAYIRDELYSAGALFASMSGSGASVYALSDRELDIPESLRPYHIWSEQLS